MLNFSFQEHSTLSLKRILNSLGYIKLAQAALGRNADINTVIEKAIGRFQRKNQERLAFLDITIKNQNLVSSGVAGVVPLEFALGGDEKANLLIEPMINWQTISSFASLTKDRSWLSINQEWETSKVLDIELWYFAKPFLFEAVRVLKRPAKGFRTLIKQDSVPSGNTNWTDFSINKFPFNKIEFENKYSTTTYDVLPHSIILWATNAIENSINNIELVPQDILLSINNIKETLGKNISPVIPARNNLLKLPKSGAWTGYLNLYLELEHIAIMSGVLNEDKTKGCAYSIKTEKLFEEFTVFLCQEFAKQNSFSIFKDSDDSSRIGLLNEGANKFTMLSSLRPDVALTSSDTLIIIDAKYKRHFDLANTNSSKDSEWYKEMTNDFHQVISYKLFSNKVKNIFLLTHPKLTGGSPVNVWRTSRGKNNFVGFLPIELKGETEMGNIIAAYEKNLNLIISKFAS